MQAFQKKISHIRCLLEDIERFRPTFCLIVTAFWGYIPDPQLKHKTRSCSDVPPPARAAAQKPLLWRNPANRP